MSTKTEINAEQARHALEMKELSLKLTKVLMEEKAVLSQDITSTALFDEDGTEVLVGDVITLKGFYSGKNHQLVVGADFIDPVSEESLFSYDQTDISGLIPADYEAYRRIQH